MKKEVMFLVGNGFNYFVGNYVRNQKNNEEFLENLINTLKKDNNVKTKEDAITLIDDISGILENYCCLLDDIILGVDSDIKGEELLAELEKLGEAFNCGAMNEFETKICDKKIQDMQKIKEESLTRYPHVTVRTMFKDKGVFFSQQLIEIFDNIRNDTIKVVTTNYDMIVEAVFSEGKLGNKVEEIEYIAPHGDYYIYSKKPYVNKELICCAPDKKEEKIDEELLKQLSGWIDNTDIMVLFGIGLTSDPHILKRLNKLENKTFIIIDADRNEYFKKRYYKTNDDKTGFDFLFKNDIYFIDTYSPIFDNYRMISHMKTPDQLLNSLTEIIREIEKNAV